MGGRRVLAKPRDDTWNRIIREIAELENVSERVVEEAVLYQFKVMADVIKNGDKTNVEIRMLGLMVTREKWRKEYYRNKEEIIQRKHDRENPQEEK